MDDGDGDGDARTFNVDFSGEGFAELREAVKEKLKEFLGDYTDDTLAEYVIVLLRNGRQKEEVRKELSVFLEKDSVAFVSWLWDHLSLNLHLYLPAKDDSIGEENEDLEKSIQDMEYLSGGFKSDLDENDQKKPTRGSSNRRNREWRGVGRAEADTLFQSTSVENVLQEKTLRQRSPVRRSRSPRHEKRRRHNEKQTSKDTITKPVLQAPSRLLQFAVRDAVKTTSQSTPRTHQISTPKPSTKRLRSIISTSSIISSPDEVPQRTIPSSGEAPVPKSSRNVFSRLGVIRNSEQELTLKDSEDFKNNGQDDEMSKSGSDEENYINVNGSSDGNIFLGHEELKRETQRDNRQIPSAVGVNTVNKIVSTRKLPQSPLQKGPMVVCESQEEKMETSQQNSVNRLVEESSTSNDQKDVQKSTMPVTGSSYSISRPSEDADIRTIFISNVHFAATKDTLSRHFNKFGEVLKVIIVTDAATGQPTGSAYVEFLRNESAELALSLNGTSFMSRILKIVLRSSPAHQEAAATTPWSRGSTWGQQAYPSRVGRYSFSRAAMAGAFRSRLPLKPGARSLQWKRDSPSPTAVIAGNSLLSPTGRSLTYIRSKPDPASA